MTVSLYQIHYSDDVAGVFDPDFVKYDCRETPENERREIAHMQRFFEGGVWKDNNSSHFGLVSPKFTSKTKLRGNEFIHWINSNPGYDVYFVNPFPHLQYLHFNVWEQGEYWHPGLLELADSLFKAADLDIQTKKLPRNTHYTLLYSNYWIANERFWREFMGFVRKLSTAVDNLTDLERGKFFARAPHYEVATYYPFVFERMFSTFLFVNNGFKCLPYPFQKDEIISRCANEMECLILKDWAGLIDVWDAQDRNDHEVRKIFANLENIQKMSLSYYAWQVKSPTANPKRYWFQLIRDYFS